MKKYRVNESEHFNLMSMHNKLKCMEIDAREKGNFDTLEEIEKRLEEIENLLDVAYCIGAKVTWSQLKRIREIRDERNYMRYNMALSNGASEKEAGNAFL